MRAAFTWPAVAAQLKDIYAEPKLLGKRIHQIHVKNADMLLSTPGGRLDCCRFATAESTSSCATVREPLMRAAFLFNIIGRG